MIYASKPEAGQFTLPVFWVILTHSPPTMAPATRASIPPIIVKMGKAIHMSFQFRHWTIQAQSAVMKCTPPTSSRVQ